MPLLGFFSLLEETSVEETAWSILTQKRFTKSPN